MKKACNNRHDAIYCCLSAVPIKSLCLIFLRRLGLIDMITITQIGDILKLPPFCLVKALIESKNDRDDAHHIDHGFGHKTK